MQQSLNAIITIKSTSLRRLLVCT